MELNYIRCGDYYIPELKLPEEKRPIGSLPYVPATAGLLLASEVIKDLIE